MEYFTNNNLLLDFTNEQKEKVTIKTYFTNDAYNSILKELDDQVGKGGIKLSKYFKDFIHTGQKYNVFKSVKQYEKCYQFTKLSATECAIFFEFISKHMGLKQVPWPLYSRLFLSKDGKMLNSAKWNLHYYKNYAKIDIDKMKKLAEGQALRCLNIKDI